MMRMLTNFSLSHILSSPLFLVTFALAFPAWIIAFASQIAAEAKYHNGSTIDVPDLDLPSGSTGGTGSSGFPSSSSGSGSSSSGGAMSGRSFNTLATISAVGGSNEPVVKYLWYAIWIQLAVTIHLFLALGTGSLATHRLQIAIFTAIAEVFAVYGANFIFSDGGALIAVGVGWLLIAMIDLIWILYLTSEPDTFLYRLLSFGNRGAGPNFGRQRSFRSKSGVAGYGDENGVSGAGLSGGMGGGVSSGNYNPGSPLNGAGQGYSGVGAGAASYGQLPTEHSAPKLGAVGNFDQSGAPGEAQEPVTQRAKAMYAYNASPDDPNEVSFAKGDLLEVIDNTGKWFQVRTPGGQTGIAPSNYLTLL